MIVVNLYGSGPRGMLKVAVAIFVVAMLGLTFVLGGCGDDEQSVTGSQLDDEAAGASTSTVGGAGSIGGAVTDEEKAMVDYPMDQCTSEMTERYGNVEMATRVCTGLQTDYSNSQRSELATILPTVEAKVSATPLPGSTIPGTDGQTGGDTGNNSSNTGSDTGSNSNGGSNSWDEGIEIIVPPSP